MTGEKTKLKGPLYSCSICTQWVQENTVVTSENKLDGMHFCGTECYEKWRDQQTADTVAVAMVEAVPSTV
jgi:hypothetical protein